LKSIPFLGNEHRFHRKLSVLRDCLDLLPVSLCTLSIVLRTDALYGYYGYYGYLIRPRSSLSLEASVTPINGTPTGYPCLSLVHFIGPWYPSQLCVHLTFEKSSKRLFVVKRLRRELARVTQFRWYFLGDTLLYRVISILFSYGSKRSNLRSNLSKSCSPNDSKTPTSPFLVYLKWIPILH
jgi:hypothetical protein